jgi:hypothetical protein
MKMTFLPLFLLLSFIALVSTLEGAQAPFDGTYWRACPLEVKRFYIQGAVSGILLGQDRMVQQGLPGEEASPLTPECHRAVVALADRLERQVAGWDAERLVAALDAFYADPDHLPLGVKWALMAVLLELPGSRQQNGQQP